MGRFERIKFVDRAKKLEYLKNILTAIMIVLLQISFSALLAYFERIQNVEALLYVALATLISAIIVLAAILWIVRELYTTGEAIVI